MNYTEDVTFVIARHKENVNWADNIDKVVIVQKDEDLPNEGREPKSFIWYIINFYDSLEGVYCFVQGNPFDHSPQLFADLERPVNEFRWLTGNLHASFEDGTPSHGGLPLQEVAESLGLQPEYPIPFMAGGQFVVTAKEIKSKPLAFWYTAYELFDLHENVPWCFERLWEEIFKGEKK